jgi:hypothetical protein
LRGDKRTSRNAQARDNTAPYGHVLSGHCVEEIKGTRSVLHAAEQKVSESSVKKSGQKAFQERQMPQTCRPWEKALGKQ